MKRARYSQIAKYRGFEEYTHNIMHLVPTRCISGLECVAIDENTFIAKIDEKKFIPSWLNGTGLLECFQDDEIQKIEVLNDPEARPKLPFDVELLLEKTKESVSSLSSMLKILKQKISPLEQSTGNKKVFNINRDLIYII